MKRVKICAKSFVIPSYKTLFRPLNHLVPCAPELLSRSNKPLAMNLEELLHVLVYFHLQEHSSGRAMLQELKQDDLARQVIAPQGGLCRSTFFETINDRGVEQFMFIFQELQKQAASVLPNRHPELGKLVAVDGSLIEAVLSMHWAEYRTGSNKAKLHLGFDINHGIPKKLALTDGKGGERPFVSQIVEPGETGILDRGYQDHCLFEQWRKDDRHFVCRIKDLTSINTVAIFAQQESTGFHDAKVRLKTADANQSREPLRLVGYKVGGKQFWLVTDRFDLTAEQVAMIYKLRWDIEKFFGWWKRHLKVYHLIARSEHGLMMQIIAGLITYLLLAIYCHEQHGETVSIARVRELRCKIRNEALLAMKKHYKIPAPKKKQLSQRLRPHARF